MKGWRTILVIVGVLIAIGLLAQEDEQLVGKEAKVLSLNLPKWKRSIDQDWNLKSNLSWNNDIVVTYQRPYCCKRWTWYLNLPLQGDDMIYRLGLKFKLRDSGNSFH